MKKLIKIAAIAGMLLAALVYGLRSSGYLREGALWGAEADDEERSVGTEMKSAGGFPTDDALNGEAAQRGEIIDSSLRDTESRSEGAESGVSGDALALSGDGSSSTAVSGSTSTDTESGNQQPASQSSAPEDVHPAIMVHVCGCVNSPGVYGFAEDARLYEAIEAAGGFTEEADETYMNLAAYLSDGIKIYVPAKGEIVNGTDAAGMEYSQIGTVSSGSGAGAGNNVATGSGTGSAEAVSAGKVDINSADENELQILPGIGPSRAKDIISYRKKNGSFSSIEDIMNVPGIKEAAYSKIKDMIVAR